MAELSKKRQTLQLEAVARYLRCDPARLATALRRMIETPSSIEYGIDKYGEPEAACITRRLHTDAEEEAEELSKVAEKAVIAAKKAEADLMDHYQKTFLYSELSKWLN